MRIAAGLLLVAAWFGAACSSPLAAPEQPLDTIARVTGSDPSDLHLLEERPLAFAYLPGRFALFIVRDLSTQETHSVALDLDDAGTVVDVAELRERDRVLGEKEGHRLAAVLLDRVLRHPDLPRMRVRVRFAPDEPWTTPGARERFQARLDSELERLDIEMIALPAAQPVVEVSLSSRAIVRLGGSALVESIDGVGVPEVPG